MQEHPQQKGKIVRRNIGNGPFTFEGTLSNGQTLSLKISKPQAQPPAHSESTPTLAFPLRTKAQIKELEGFELISFGQMHAKLRLDDTVLSENPAGYTLSSEAIGPDLATSKIDYGDLLKEMKGKGFLSQELKDAVHRASVGLLRRSATRPEADAEVARIKDLIEQEYREGIYANEP